VVQFSNLILEKIIAPGVASLTNVSIPDLRQNHPEAPHWLGSQALNTITGGQFAGRGRRWAINMVFRAANCFEYFHLARERTIEYVSKTPSGSLNVPLYFDAIKLWEGCLINMSIAMDVHRTFCEVSIFNKGDGSSEQRAYSLANLVKHCASGNIGEPITTPVWITNSGLCGVGGQISYGELSDIISDLAVAADDLQNPKELHRRRSTDPSDP
jgi:hypothetical protein